MKRTVSSALALESTGNDAPAHAAAVPVRATLDHFTCDGEVVCVGSFGRWVCDVLVTPGLNAALQPGDRLLVLPPCGDDRAVVLGRIARAVQLEKPSTLCIESRQGLTLKCGEASIDLRADGKVMIRGEDVLVRAKGTKRIRAGTVAIN